MIDFNAVTLGRA